MLTIITSCLSVFKFVAMLQLENLTTLIRTKALHIHLWRGWCLFDGVLLGSHGEWYLALQLKMDSEREVWKEAINTRNVQSYFWLFQWLSRRPIIAESKASISWKSGFKFSVIDYRSVTSLVARSYLEVTDTKAGLLKIKISYWGNKVIVQYQEFYKDNQWKQIVSKSEWQWY